MINLYIRQVHICVMLTAALACFLLTYRKGKEKKNTNAQINCDLSPTKPTIKSDVRMLVTGRNFTQLQHLQERWLLQLKLRICDTITLYSKCPGVWRVETGRCSGPSAERMARHPGAGPSSGHARTTQALLMLERSSHRNRPTHYTSLLKAIHTENQSSVCNGRKKTWSEQRSISFLD